MLARQVADVPLAAEVPELADAAVAVHRRADRLDALELGQLGVALVDLLELELVLQPGVVEVVLLVELGDEAVGAGSRYASSSTGDVGVSLGTARRIPAVREISLRTERRTQLLDITQQVEDALDGVERGRRRARLRASHHGRRDDQRGHRPGSRRRHRGRDGEDRRGRLGLEARRRRTGRTRPRTCVRR